MGFDAEFVIIGHRGAAGLAPENTLRSFRLAERLGVDAVELDIQLADGRLAVFHDSTLERTTNGIGSLQEKSWEAIQALDAGDGERIPELRQVFDALDCATGVNIELKGEGSGEVLAGYLNSTDISHPLLVSSFSLDELETFRTRHRSTAIALLLKVPDATKVRRAIALGAWSIHLHDQLATSDRVARCIDQGLQVFVYSVNELARFSELQTMGARGVFTDFPDRLSQRPQAASRNCSRAKRA